MVQCDSCTDLSRRHCCGSCSLCFHVDKNDTKFLSEQIEPNSCFPFVLLIFHLFHVLSQLWGMKSICPHLGHRGVIMRWGDGPWTDRRGHQVPTCVHTHAHAHTPRCDDDGQAARGRRRQEDEQGTNTEVKVGSRRKYVQFHGASPSPTPWAAFTAVSLEAASGPVLGLGTLGSRPRDRQSLLHKAYKLAWKCHRGVTCPARPLLAT